MQRHVSVRLTIDQARQLAGDLRAMIRAYDAASGDALLGGHSRRGMAFSKRAVDCEHILEAIEGAIAACPQPLYAYELVGMGP